MLLRLMVMSKEQKIKMETRQGKIEEKALKFASNKAPYATFKIDGKSYNSFDKEIVDNHNPDDFSSSEYWSSLSGGTFPLAGHSHLVPIYPLHE